MLSPKSAVWIFVLGCLLSSARLVMRAPATTEEVEENVQRSGERFAAIREALPTRGVIGYIGPSEGGLGYYYLAQYALAPLVVDHSPDHAIVIGNFPNSAPPQLPSNLEVVRDFGGGLLLLANRDAR